MPSRGMESTSQRGDPVSGRAIIGEGSGPVKHAERAPSRAGPALGTGETRPPWTRVSRYPGEVSPSKHQVGPFRIENRLGGGAVAEVYRATRIPGGESVALKLLRIGCKPEERRRFVEEARLTRDLESRRLVRVVEQDLVSRRPWIAMEFLPGRDLAKVLVERPEFARESAPGICTGLLEALRDLQEAGLNHRDVTPANIILDEQGEPRLVDLGSVGRAGAGGAGTLAYLSPEALRGELRGAAGDLYQVGAVLYEVLSGLVPHEDLGGGYLDRRKAGDPPAPLHELTAGASRAVSELLADLLHPDPGSRPTVPQALGRARSIGAPWFHGPPVPLLQRGPHPGVPGRARRLHRRALSRPGSTRPDRAPSVRPLGESVVAALGLGGALLVLSYLLGWL